MCDLLTMGGPRPPKPIDPWFPLAGALAALVGLAVLRFLNPVM
jgi:hypothetical protein